MSLLLLCLVISGASLAQPQKEAAPAKQASKAQQRGSDANPLSVKIVPAPNADEKAAREEQYRKEALGHDRDLVWATIWLAGVTTALAIFTALLWVATYRLWRGSQSAESGLRQTRTNDGRAGVQFNFARVGGRRYNYRQRR